MKKLLLALLMVASLFAASNQSQTKNFEQDFTLTTIDGKKIHISVDERGIKVKEYPNRVIILDFFGKHCPPCRMEMPILGALQTKMKGKLQIIGLHVQEPLTLADIKDLQSQGINYPVADYLSNPANKAFVDYMAQATRWQGSIPYLLFFAKDGEYAGYHIGLASAQGLEHLVQELYTMKEKVKK